MRMSVSEVVEIAKKFVRSQAGYSSVEIASVDALTQQGRWKVLADVGLFATMRKELIIDDSDGNILSYRQI